MKNLRLRDVKELAEGTPAPNSRVVTHKATAQISRLLLQMVKYASFWVPVPHAETPRWPEKDKGLRSILAYSPFFSWHEANPKPGSWADVLTHVDLEGERLSQQASGRVLISERPLSNSEGLSSEPFTLVLWVENGHFPPLKHHLSIPPSLLKLSVLATRPGGERALAHQTWERPQRRALQEVTQPRGPVTSEAWSPVMTCVA